MNKHGYKDLFKKKTSDKLRDYRRTDKRAGFKTSVSLEGMRFAAEMPCFFCCGRTRLGLDRIENSLGHLNSNCVPCCAECNFILIDLPWEAKLELREPLRKIREKGILKDWLAPPERKKVVEVKIHEEDLLKEEEKL